MRWTSAFLAFGFGMVSAALSGTTRAENAPPAPTNPPPAARNTSAKPAGPQNKAGMDSTAITESTEAGQKVAGPTADHPVYVVIHSGGRHDFGSAIAENKAPSPETIDRQMESSLARSHYLRADANRQPSLLIVFSWGIHGVVGEGEAAIDPDYRNLLDRASLVGGSGFASELRKVLIQNERAQDATPTGRWGPQQPDMRSPNAASLFQASSPFEVFRRRDQKTENLLVQLSNDCYYVVISAFDSTTVGKGKSQLLWRTKLTAAAPGISMAEAIPSLIANGSRYLGRSMTEAEVFSSH
jgi:hypothetical protein